MSRHESFVIIGLTLDGKRFRPSDWAERLCGTMSVFGAERRMAYSPYVQPGTLDGEKCVFVRATDAVRRAREIIERATRQVANENICPVQINRRAVITRLD